MKSRHLKNSIFISGLIALAVIASVQIPTANSAVGQKAPDVTSPVWINGAPQRMSDLSGKVVLVEFWTFGCSNCRNVEPYVKAWHAKYAQRGVTIISVHSPEFPHESDIDNVRRYVKEHAIQHAVAIDNDFSVWNSYKNRFWPAFYLIDKRGMIRYTHIGEGAYSETERQIENLLAEK